jgi:hypothetical protein
VLLAGAFHVNSLCPLLTVEIYSVRISAPEAVRRRPHVQRAGPGQNLNRLRSVSSGVNSFTPATAAARASAAGWLAVSVAGA